MTTEVPPNPSTAAPPKWRPQFTLRALLVAGVVVAVWLSVAKIALHVAVLLAGMGLPALFTVWLVRARRRLHGRKLGTPARALLAGLRALTVLGWFVAYVVSIGPVVAVVQAVGVNPKPFEAIYAPVIWLHDATPLKEPLEAYAAGWGWD